MATNKIIKSALRSLMDGDLQTFGESISAELYARTVSPIQEIEKQVASQIFENTTELAETRFKAYNSGKNHLYEKLSKSEKAAIDEICENIVDNGPDDLTAYIVEAQYKHGVGSEILKEFFVQSLLEQRGKNE